jgi:hypothetical protein
MEAVEKTRRWGARELCYNLGPKGSKGMYEKSVLASTMDMHTSAHLMELTRRHGCRGPLAWIYELPFRPTS